MMESIIKNWDAIAGLLGLLLAWVAALPKVRGWMIEVDEKAREYHLESARKLALGVAADLYQSTVRELKTSGKFDADAKRRVKDVAVQILAQAIKTEGISVAREILPALIEMAVNALKADAALVPAHDKKTDPAEPEVEIDELEELVKDVQG